MPASLHAFRARELTRLQELFTIRQGVILTADPACQQQLDATIAGALRLAVNETVEPASPALLCEALTERTLSVTAAVVPDDPGRQIAALLRIREAKPPNVPKLEDLQSELGLTAAEAALTLALAGGITVTGYAEREGLSVHTVRSHMKWVREKLRVRRQVDVLRRIVEFPRAGR